eukprot:sb/3478373/
MTLRYRNILPGSARYPEPLKVSYNSSRYLLDTRSLAQDSGHSQNYPDLSLNSSMPGRRQVSKIIYATYVLLSRHDTPSPSVPDTLRIWEGLEWILEDLFSI